MAAPDRGPGRQSGAPRKQNKITGCPHLVPGHTHTAHPVHLASWLPSASPVSSPSTTAVVNTEAPPRCQPARLPRRHTPSRLMRRSPSGRGHRTAARSHLVARPGSKPRSNAPTPSRRYDVPVKPYHDRLLISSSPSFYQAKIVRAVLRHAVAGLAPSTWPGGISSGATRTLLNRCTRCGRLAARSLVCAPSSFESGPIGSFLAAA